MAKFEIERKFLLKNDEYQNVAYGTDSIIQGYLSCNPDSTVRVRIKNQEAFITVKGITRGYTREEYEYSIPYDDALRMIEMCGRKVIRKKRFYVRYEDLVWEIDRFEGDLEGLVIAEVELSDENKEIMFPPFIGLEVTGNADYYNSNLIGKRFNVFSSRLT